MTPGGHGKWLTGALRLSPGSILWVPAKASAGPPVDLTAAVVTPQLYGMSGPIDTGPVDLETPAGSFQLEMPADLFMMTQELVAGAATGEGQDLGPADPGTF